MAVQCGIALNGTGRVSLRYCLTAEDTCNTQFRPGLGGRMVFAQLVPDLGQERIMCDIRKVSNVHQMRLALASCSAHRAGARPL